jgi:hypothetical protein
VPAELWKDARTGKDFAAAFQLLEAPRFGPAQCARHRRGNHCATAWLRARAQRFYLLTRWCSCSARRLLSTACRRHRPCSAPRRSGPALPGRLIALHIFPSKFSFYGCFVWARRSCSGPFSSVSGPGRARLRSGGGSAGRGRGCDRPRQALGPRGGPLRVRWHCRLLYYSFIHFIPDFLRD